MNKKVLHGKEYREKVLQGVEEIGLSVTSTLGPKGLTVGLWTQGRYAVTKDGASVAKSMGCDNDPGKAFGLDSVRNASLRVNMHVGDGTTTVCLLSLNMVREGFKAVEAGHDPSAIKAGMLAALDVAVEEIVRMSRPITGNPEAMRKISTTSANGDVGTGGMISGIFEKNGPDAAIRVDEGRGAETVVQFFDGFQFDNGWVSQSFVNTPNTMEARYQDCRILVADRDIMFSAEILPVLEACKAASAPLLIICSEIGGDALPTLEANRAKNPPLPVVVVQAPAFGRDRVEILNDICLLTGAKLVTSATGLTMDKITSENVLDILGTASDVRVGRNATQVVVGNAVDKAPVADRIKMLKAQVESTNDEKLKVNLKSRISMLTSGLTVISVGASGEAEMVFKMHTIDDCIRALRCAMHMGIVPGGGVIQARASKAVRDAIPDDAKEAVKIGWQIVADALMENLASLAGRDSAEFKEVLESEGWAGYDARAEAFGDMYDLGVVDPALVSIISLESAVSTASMIITTNTLIFPHDAQ